MKQKKNFDLKNYNSYNIESKCKLAYFPENEDDIIKLYSVKQDYILIGSGHNLILSKTYYDSDFIVFNGNFEGIDVFKNKNIISAEAGATILKVSETAFQNSLTGMEFFYDIPSSVGGAVVMNAGTKEGETKNILQRVRYLDLNDLIIKERYQEELDFEYRNSIFQKQKDKVILKAWFQLKPGVKSNIRHIMDMSKERRWARQPRELPNSGSVFKRPPGAYVGPMIDELGLKGFKIGGAQISTKHSGFIINYDNASGEDIIDLITYIQKKVYGAFKIKLEVEQRII